VKPFLLVFTGVALAELEYIKKKKESVTPGN